MLAQYPKLLNEIKTMQKPLIFFDLETTGVNVSNDRIVQLSAKKITSPINIGSINSLVNPTIPIPPEATAIHGITNEMVAKELPFKEKAKEWFEWFQGCDLAGFNHISFDTPLLSEEFARCGYEFPDPTTLFVDIKNIFHKKEERTLSAAVKFYCDRSHDSAHNAMEDVQATIDVFNRMKKYYPDLPETTQGLHDYCLNGKPMVDFAGKLTKNDKGEILYNFGRHIGKKVTDEIQYAQWMINSDFPNNTKTILRRILKEAV